MKRKYPFQKQIKTEIIKKELDSQNKDKDKLLNKKTKRIKNNDKEILSKSEPKKVRFLQILIGNSYSYLNYPSFCAFNSINDIFYLIYTDNNNSIICYNIIENKKINEIKKAHKDIRICFKHFLDEKFKRDLIISFSQKGNNLKLWNINNFECLLNLENLFFGNNKFSACFLKDNNENYIIVGCSSLYFNEYIKIFDFNGNKIKEIFVKISKINAIESYYDIKFSKNYILTGNSNCVKAYDFDNNKEFQTYLDEKNIFRDYKEIIVNNKKEMTQLIASNNVGKIIIWDFYTKNIIKIINACTYYEFNAICLWDTDYLFVGWGDKTIKLINLNNFEIVKTLNGHKNNITTIKKVNHSHYGDFLISQEKRENSQIKLWGIRKIQK